MLDNHEQMHLKVLQKEHMEQQQNQNISEREREGERERVKNEHDKKYPKKDIYIHKKDRKLLVICD